MQKIQTLEQTKSTSVASSSPIYSIIFLLIHGLIRRSIRVWEKTTKPKRLIILNFTLLQQVPNRHLEDSNSYLAEDTFRYQ